MSLVNMNAMLNQAQNQRYAVANFDICDSILLRGTMRAAAESKAPVILAYAEVFENMIPMSTFTPMLLAEASQAPIPVCIHLDHARSLEYIGKALNCGFTSAMFDGSDLPFEENVRQTKMAADLCHAQGASCEAELGHVGGLDGYDYSGDPYTDVRQAMEFVERTGVDALAVSIGTVHGVYREKPKLNFVRLAELRNALSVPLVLHGGSGLSETDFRTVISEGIAKVNIFTELTLAACAQWQAASGGYMDSEVQVIEAVCRCAKDKIALFGSQNAG